MLLCLLQVMRYSEQLSSSGKIVGEFVPPSSYISSQLLEYLSRRNAALASLQSRVCHTSAIKSKLFLPNFLRCKRSKRCSLVVCRLQL